MHNVRSVRSEMLSVIAVVCFTVIALQATFVFCLPAGTTEEHAADNTLSWSELHKDDENDDSGYQVISLTKKKVVNVEVVDEAGNSRLEQLVVDVEDDEDPVTSTTPPVTSSIRPASMQHDIMRKKKGSTKSHRHPRKVHLYPCDWRELYKLYLEKRRKTIAYSKKKRLEIRKAFKTVCENPGEALKIILDMDE